MDGVDHGVIEVAKEDEVGPMRDRRLEWWPLACLQRGQAFVNARQLRFRADAGVAMAWEMLGRRQHVRSVDAIHHGADRSCNLARTRAVTTPPHDRRRAAADIRHRAKVEVEAERLDRARHLYRSRLSDRHRITRHCAD